MLKDLLLLLNDYLIGKSTYPIIRRTLNLIFSVSITSFLIETWYFSYTWLDISDYISIIDFFIKGAFFIPFTLFLVVHFGTQCFAFVVFHILNLRSSKRSLKSIYEYDAKHSDVKFGIRFFRKTTQLVVPIQITEQLLVEAYNDIKSNLNHEKIAEIEEELKKEKVNLQDSFIMVFRGIITVIIYFFTIPYFNIALFVIALASAVLFLAGSLYTYTLLDLAPSFIRKYHSAVEDYISKKSIKQTLLQDLQQTESDTAHKTLHYGS